MLQFTSNGACFLHSPALALQVIAASPAPLQGWLAHTAERQSRHPDSTPVQLMLASRLVPLPSPNVLPASTVPDVPKPSCTQGARGSN